MKNLLAIIFLLAATHALQAQATAPEVAEATRLSVQVVRLHDAGRYAEALPLAQKALELREKALGPDHTDVAMAAYNLASVYFQLNQPAQAESAGQRALQIYEKARVVPEESLANLLFLLGGIGYTRADYEPAARHLQRALALREKISGAEHPATLDTVLLLAHVYHNNNQYDSAEFLYRSYVAAQEKRGARADNLGATLERLSCVLWKKGADEEASALELRADSLLGYGIATRTVKNKELMANRLTRSSLDFQLDKKYVNQWPGLPGGIIAVRVLINPQGEVRRACAINGLPPLLPLYEALTRSARFKPFVLNGQNAATVNGEINYQYEIERRPNKPRP